MTIFSKIIAGEIPAFKIAENEKFFAFLDIFPLREGHTLVIPKTEVDKFFDLDENYLSEMLVFAKPIFPAEVIRNRSTLLVRTITGLLSVVPKKFVDALIPALPVMFQL